MITPNLHALDLNDWSSFPLEATDIVINNQQEIIGLADGGRSFKVSMDTQRALRLPGRFKVILTSSDGQVLAITQQGNLFALDSRRWKKIGDNIEGNHFFIGGSQLFSVKENKLKKQLIDPPYGKLAGGQAGKNATAVKKLEKTSQSAVVSRLETVALQKVLPVEPGKFTYTDMDDNLLVVTEKANKLLAKNIDHILYADKRFIAAKSKSRDVVLFLIHDEKGKKIKFENSHDVKAILVNGRDEMSVIDGRNIFTSPTTVSEFLGLASPQNFPDKFKLVKSKLTASSVAIGPDGLFLISETGGLKFVDAKRKLHALPGRVADFANAAIGQLWAVNHIGQIFFFDKGKWKHIKGLAKSISARGRSVMIIDDKDRVQFYSWKTKKFKPVSRYKGTKVYVQNQATFWLMQEKGALLKCSKGLKCKRFSKKKFTDVSIAKDGTVYGLDDRLNLSRFNQGKFEKLRLNIKDFRQVVGIDSANLLVLDDSNRLYVTEDFEFGNQLMPNFVSSFQSVKPITDPLRVGGKILLNGKKMSPRAIKRSAYAPNGGFRYKRDYKQYTVSNSLYFLDFNMGKDGRLWALSLTDVFQFHEKTQTFKLYNSINFGSREQKFQGLPPTISVSSITSDHEGRIWAVRQASTEVYYQERPKGRFKKTELPALRGTANITDITIDAAGAVYVAGGEVFKWESDRRRFKPLTGGGGPYIRVSSGPAGSLWAVDHRDDAFEWIGGKKYKRPIGAKFNIQDIDISVEGIVYATTKTQRRGPNEPGSGVVISPESSIECELAIYDPDTQKFTKVHRKGSHYAQFVAVAADGTPWTASAPCGSNNIIRADS